MYEQNHIVSASAMFVARQEISRKDLARWDKSARSWLHSADRSKVVQCDQLKVIIRSLPLPLTAASSTYASVISVWREAMLGMDGLLSGNPVLISNGSLFLAFSSWYSFPDLIVLGSKTAHVKFNDNLFPPGGSCTIGREMITDQPEGIRWCTIGLRVACLRLRGLQFREVKAGNTACDGCLQVMTRTRDIGLIHQRTTFWVMLIIKGALPSSGFFILLTARPM